MPSKLVLAINEIHLFLHKIGGDPNNPWGGIHAKYAKILQSLLSKA
jgi:hypothetical protein